VATTRTATAEEKRALAEAGVERTVGSVRAAGAYKLLSSPHVEAKKVILKSLPAV
jgi:hypothetical protein